MTKSRFPYVNRFAGTMTASSAATSYPVSNLSSPARWKKWRSANSTSDQWIKVQRGESSSVTCALLADWRAYAGGAIRLQMNGSDSWGSPAFDQAFTLPSANPTKVIALWFAGRTETWIRFLFTNPGAVNTYVEAGIAFVGPYFEPTVNLVDGTRFTRVDPSQVRQSIGGQQSVVARQRYFAIESLFQDIAAADKTAFLTMEETVGTVTPLFFAVDGDDVDQMVYGRLPSQLVIAHVIRDRWSVTVPFEESR